MSRCTLRIYYIIIIIIIIIFEIEHFRAEFMNAIIIAAVPLVCKNKLQRVKDQ